MSTNDKSLIVVIHGQIAAGKTTLALAFKEFLEQKGFTNVSINDVDVAYETHYPELQEQRMESIKDRKVYIETRQERKL